MDRTISPSVQRWIWVEGLVVMGGIVGLTVWGGWVTWQAHAQSFEALQTEARTRYRFVTETPKPSAFLPVTKSLFSPAVVPVERAPVVVRRESPPVIAAPPQSSLWEAELRQYRFVGFTEKKGVKLAWINTGREDVFVAEGQPLGEAWYVKSFLSKGAVIGAKSQPGFKFTLE